MRSDRLLSIDALRGVAVLAVLIAHLPFGWSPTPVRPETEALAVPAFPLAAIQIADYGRFGVNLFLVISGFCIHMRWARRPGPMIDFTGFWRRRLTRLYPPYLVAVLGSFAGLFVLFGILGHATNVEGAFGYASLDHLGADALALVLLVQNFTDASYNVGNPPFWTLALEEQLYLLYFPMLFVRRRWGWRWALGAVVAISLAWRVPPLFVALPEQWIRIGPARWIEWALGALAVESMVGIVKLPAWCSSLRFAGTATALAIVVNLPAMRSVATLVGDAAFGIAFFGWINAAVRLDLSGALARIGATSVLARVGLFSYSLYLIQEPAIVAAKHLLLRLGLTPGVWQAIVMSIGRMAIAIALAYLFFTIVERPFVGLSRRIGVGRARAEPSAAPRTT